jgi:hypothetical protein
VCSTNRQASMGSASHRGTTRERDASYSVKHHKRRYTVYREVTLQLRRGHRDAQSQPALSPGQIARSSGWRRPEEILSEVVLVKQPVTGRDIVQDVITDCSLVAGLIVCAEHHAKFGSRVSKRNELSN